MHFQMSPFVILQGEEGESHFKNTYHVPDAFMHASSHLIHTQTL